MDPNAASGARATVPESQLSISNSQASLASGAESLVEFMNGMA